MPLQVSKTANNIERYPRSRPAVRTRLGECVGVGTVLRGRERRQCLLLLGLAGVLRDLLIFDEVVRPLSANIRCGRLIAIYAPVQGHTALLR